jgi:hypothetical protein
MIMASSRQIQPKTGHDHESGTNRGRFVRVPSIDTGLHRCHGELVLRLETPALQSHRFT